MRHFLLILAILTLAFASRGTRAATLADAKTNAVAVISTNVSLPQAVLERLSKFVADLPNARNPFFPNSKGLRDTAGTNTSVVVPVVQVAPEELLVLRGISGPATGRFALVNDRILKQGEEVSVRTSSGPVKIKCLEITETTVVLKINDEDKNKELRLRSGP